MCLTLTATCTLFQALQEQGEFENAMEKYAAAHKIQPENPVHLVYKG